MKRVFVLREATHLASLAAFLKANWQACAREGKFLSVTVALYQSRRSLEQNRRYFGPAVLGQVAAQAWLAGRQYSKESWHEHFKRQFIGLLDIPGGGVVGMSSTDLSVEEFGQFMLEVEAYAAQELGVDFDAPPAF